MPSITYQDYGRLGGQATLARYGKEFFSHIGRRGGRPHGKTLIQLRQQSAPEAQFKENGGRLPNSLKGLKELYAAKYKRGEAV